MSVHHGNLNKEQEKSVVYQQQEKNEELLNIGALMPPEEMAALLVEDEKEEEKIAVKESQQTGEEALKSLPPSLEFIDLKTTILRGKPLSSAIQERMNREKASWKAVREFKTKIRLNKAGDTDEETYADKTLADMTTAIIKDTGSKSELYTDMQNALEALSKMASSDGKYTDKNGNLQNADFYEVLYRARETTDLYVTTHSKRRRFSAKGEKRLALSKRIQSLLLLLEKDVETARKEANLELSKEKNKEESVEEKKTTEELRQIEDELGKEKANREAIATFIEEHPDLTLRISRMKCTLLEYIMNKLQETPDALIKPIAEFTPLLVSIGESFEAEQHENIERAKKRREKTLKNLGIKDPDDAFLRAETLADMFLDMDDEKFEAELKELINQAMDNDAMIAGIVERRVAPSFAPEMYTAIKNMLGSARIFGGALDICILATEYIDRIKFTNPELFLRMKEVGNWDAWLEIEKVENKDDRTGMLGDFSFVSRMKGDLLLQSPEIKAAFTEEERAFLARNMTSFLVRALQKDNLDAYNTMTFREYRMAAKCLKTRLLNNIEKYRALRENDAEQTEVKNGVLLRLADANTTAETFDAIVSDVKKEIADDQLRQRQRYLIDIATGALPKDEMKGVKDEDWKEAGPLVGVYIARLNVLKKAMDGRFAALAEYLARVPEVFDAMMATDEQVLKDYLETKLIEKYGALAEGLSNKDVAPAAKELYLRENFEHIKNGKLTGDAAFFKARLNEFNHKLYNEKYDKKNTVSGNIDKAIAYVDEMLGELYSDKDFAFKEGAKLAAFNRLNELNATPEAFQIFYNQRKLNASLLKAIERYENEFDKAQKKLESNEKAAQVANAAIQQEKDQKQPAPGTGFDAISKEIEAEKQKGKGRRDAFLAINNAKVDEMRKNKSMIMADHRSQSKIRLSKSDIDERRGRVDRICGYLNLPEILKSILIERISAAEGLSEILSDETLLRAGRRMEELYRLLPKAAEEEEEKMGDEEVLMLITNLFANPNTLGVFYQESLEVSAKKVLGMKEVKAFRANYAKLVEFEKVETTDSSLAQEQREMSRNLRAILLTGAGLYDEKGRKVQGKLKETADHEKLFGEACARHISYLTMQNRFLSLLNECLNTHNDYKDRSMLYKERAIPGFRAYFQNRLMNDLAAGKDFDEEAYRQAIGTVLDDATKMKIVIEEPLSVSSETHPWLYDKAFDDEHTQEDLDKLIQENTLPFFKGCVKRYRALDTDQRKLFAVALALLDKGAIGIDTGGTNNLLSSDTLKNRQEAKLEEQIAEYIAGGELHVTVDYKEAMNKLINVGVQYKMDWTAVSESAFEKAHEFAVQIKQKRIEAGDRDTERLSDGISSIRAASAMGAAAQYNEAQKLIGTTLTVDDVYNRLLMYAKTDGNSAMENFFKTISPNLRTRYMRLLVRVLQDRSILDTTTLYEGTDFVDGGQRNALMELLSGSSETREAGLRGFDDEECCHKALITALSFQLRDDVNFSGKELTKDHFAKDALKRKSLVDWNLIGKAMTFIQEATQKSLSIYAVKNAPKYISYSGNQKAIDLYENVKSDFKERKDVAQTEFDALLKKEAENSLDDQPDAKMLVGGYQALTPQQKKLFVKVLGQRDLLDISKKNLFKNLFLNAKRNFVNEAGRNALIDEYIRTSLGDGSGVILGEGAHFSAIESLLSTQIDDTAQFSSTDHVDKIIASERCFIGGRKTAVDWKLFKRALNFVHRASDELAMQEGNAELYRAAGDIAADGSFKMDYKFLRRNFHNTGTRYFRFGAKNALNRADKYLGASKFAGALIGSDTSLFGKKGVGSYILSDKFRVRINTAIKDAKGMLPNTQKESINKISVKEGGGKAPEPVLFYDVAKKQMDAIFAKKDSLESEMSQISSVFKKYVTDTTGYAQMFYADAPGKVTSKTKSKTGEWSSGVKKEYEKNKGDIRDIYGFGKKIYEGYMGEVSALQSVGKIPLAKALLDQQNELVDYIKSKIISRAILTMGDGNLPNLSPEEKKKSISKISAEVQHYLKNIIGDTKAAKLLDTAAIVDGIAKDVEQRLGWISKVAGYASKVASSFASMAEHSANVIQVEQAELSAKVKHAESDKQKLKDAEAHQDERQKKLAKDAAEKNKDYTDMAAATTKALQGFGFTSDVINLAIDTVNTFVKGLHVPTQMISEAVSMGAEFALYATRCMVDQATLRDYYKNTPQGKQVVNDIKAGAKAAYPNDDKMQKEMEDSDVLTVVMNGRGFEKMEELTEYTGMSIAQTVVFSASKYNPMQQSRLVATTVMAVLGCGDLIGDISPTTVESVYQKMSAG